MSSVLRLSIDCVGYLELQRIRCVVIHIIVIVVNH